MALRVPATRINDIVNEKRGITADTALRLSRYFGTTPKFWTNMQASWELEVAEDLLGNEVRRDVLPRTRERSESGHISGPVGHNGDFKLSVRRGRAGGNYAQLREWRRVCESAGQDRAEEDPALTVDSSEGGALCDRENQSPIRSAARRRPDYNVNIPAQAGQAL